MKKKVTAQDIANELGVSICTVNKALSGKPKVSEARRRQIQEKAREMGFVVDGVAQIMARNPITIGVVISVSGENMYFDGMRKGMEAEFARLEKYKITPAYYVVSDEQIAGDGERLLDWINDKNVEAVCFCPSNLTANGVLLETIIRRGIPLFLSGGGIEPPESAITTVSVDALLSGRMVADFFYCIHRQNVHAVMVTDSVNSITQRKKREAFRQRLAAYGVEDPVIVEYADDEAALERKLDELCGAKSRVNCLYVSTGNSLPVCRYLQEHNLSDRITLVGTDYYDALKPYIDTGVMKATLLQNQRQVGRRIVRGAYDYLIKTRTFGNEDWCAPKRLYIDPTFCFKSNFQND
ncbi:MAG: LacI family DNA-binding transcriptional regulator [Clostridia bacterium]|nr:LacI family DNA-binding transcriptional regulator [Clostridia bacterium]